MKALIIGFGSIGKKHFEAIKDIYDIEFVTTQKLKNHKTYTSLEQADLNKFDLFIISNPTSKHYQTLKFINDNVKNKTILVEKPLFEKPYNINLNNKILVAYLLRFHPAIKALKDILKDIKPYFVQIVCNSYLPAWRKDTDYKEIYSAKKELGGGVLLDLSHEIDYTKWLFGEFKILNALNLKISELEISSDDLALFTCKTNDGAIITFDINYFSKRAVRTIKIDYEKGTIFADLISGRIQIFELNVTKELNFQSDTIEILRSMHKAILENDKNLCSYDDGLGVLDLIEDVRKLSKGF